MLPPANRIVAFAGPYIAVVAGGVASWLVAKVNLAGLPGLDEDNLKTALTGGFTWLLVAGLAWAGHSKWLTGHHIQLEADGKVTAAAAQAAAGQAIAPAVATASGNGYHPAGVDVADPDQIVDDATEPEPGAEEELVSDDVEFAYPPAPASERPVEPGGGS
jgi:hypothetical protein